MSGKRTIIRGMLKSGGIKSRYLRLYVGRKAIHKVSLKVVETKVEVVDGEVKE